MLPLRGPTQVEKGDVLKMYDVASKAEFGRVFLSADPEPLPDAPAPEGWVATQWSRGGRDPSGAVGHGGQLT